MTDSAAASVVDRAGEVRDENRFDPERIRPFLRQHLPDLPEGPIELKQFEGGSSNITYQLSIGDRRMILRRPPAGTKAKSAHDMGREFRVMQRLHPYFPCPQPYAYCEDESLIGSTFYVMQKFDGVIVRRDLQAGLEYSPEQARRLAFNLFDGLARLHQLDYHAAGLGDLGKPTGYVERQVTGWCDRYERAMTDDAPDCATLMAWLEAKRPPDGARPALIHNDYRFDNVVLSPEDRFTIIGVLDWELATIGDPLMDLGGALAYWVQADDPAHMQAVRMQPSYLPGMPTRAELLAHYSERTGIDTSSFDFYYVFGLFRLGVIAQQIYYRYQLGQTTNPKFKSFGPFATVLARVAGDVIQRSAL